MDLGLKGKVVVVTGGRGAIGSAAANCFADEGARVIIADKLRGESEEERVYGTSGGVQYFRYLDLTDSLPPGGGLLYLHVDDADQLAQEWRAAGAEVTEPQDFPWGKHEGSHTDPDGNTIRFGSPLRS